MRGVIPGKVANQKAVLPVERENIGCSKIKRSVMLNLLRVHKTDDRPDALVYDSGDPLEYLWCGFGRELSSAPAEFLVITKRPVRTGELPRDDPNQRANISSVFKLTREFAQSISNVLTCLSNSVLVHHSEMAEQEEKVRTQSLSGELRRPTRRVGRPLHRG